MCVAVDSRSYLTTSNSRGFRLRFSILCFIYGNYTLKYNFFLSVYENIIIPNQKDKRINKFLAPNFLSKFPLNFSL